MGKIPGKRAQGWGPGFFGLLSRNSNNRKAERSSSSRKKKKNVAYCYLFTSPPEKTEGYTKDEEIQPGELPHEEPSNWLFSLTQNFYLILERRSSTVTRVGGQKNLPFLNFAEKTFIGTDLKDT